MSKVKSTGGLLAFSLLLAASANAGNTSKGTLQVAEPVTVGGKHLPAGTYQVERTGSGIVGLRVSLEILKNWPVRVYDLKRFKPSEVGLFPRPIAIPNNSSGF